MIAYAVEKWWLVVDLLGLIIMSIAVMYAYVLDRRGQRGALQYIPGLLLIILGLAINLSRHLSVIPSRLAAYALWLAGLLTAAGVVFLEKQWRRDKKSLMRG